jgi:phosphate transport system protein
VTDHTVRSYEEELKLLDTKIAQMGGLAEEVLGHAIDALLRRDPGLAEATIDADKKIDLMEREIEEHAITIIARRQPMAIDLRQIMTSIRIAVDLERIGDLSKNIAKRALAIAEEQHPKQLMLGLRHMGVTAMEQLHDVLDAYSERNPEKALKVWTRDDELDSMYNSIFRELLTYMMEDPRNIGLCTHLLFGAKNLERIGDHATNVAETIHFLVYAASFPDERPKSDVTSLTPASALDPARGQARHLPR